MNELLRSFLSITKYPTGSSKRSSADTIGDFHKDDDGATAVEFAMIAAPFLALIFLVIMLGHFFWVATTLEDSIQEAGRQIRIGKVQASGFSRNNFKSFICSYVATSRNQCIDNILINVESAPDISSLSLTPPRAGQETYNPGGPGEYVIVKATFSYTSINSLFRLLGASTFTGLDVYSTTAFRNEPFK